MPKKIEIFENTLLKLLVRRGTNADRLNVILSEGELGYTTDTKKLFIGDGQTPGGIAIGGGITGNGGGRFVGSSTDITLFTGAVPGDVAFDSDNFKLYTLAGGSPSNISNWTPIGGVYAAADGTITISPSNAISVGSLSAGDISSNALGNSLVVDGDSKVGVSTTAVFTNSISSFNQPYLQLPAGTAFNGVNYNWPAGGLAADNYLKIDASGNLSWAPAYTPTTLYSASTAGQIPVGSIMPFVSSNNAPIGWLLCNGQSVTTSLYSELFAVIGYNYGGSGADFNVPNLINKTLYGVQNNPATSTTYSIASGNNSALSASGALYIIKAKPDQVINVSTTIDPPLTATLNGIPQSGAFNSLSGNVRLGLPLLLDVGVQDFNNGVKVDIFGRVIGPADPLSAGAIALEELTTQVINYDSGTKFLVTPVQILSMGVNTTFSTNISVFPSIRSLTFSGGVLASSSSTGYTLPSTATGIILDSWASATNNTECMFAAASDRSLLTTSTSKTLGNKEYLVNHVKSIGLGNHVCASNQVIIPLSASAVNSGQLTFGLRGVSEQIGANSYIRIVGFTE